MRPRIEIAGDRHLETLANCDGYYECPRNKGTGERLGPLVGYAGTYDGPDGKELQFVGDVYANFAKAEPHANVLNFFAGCLAIRLDGAIGLENIDVFCGAPIGGYSLADALGLNNNIDMIKPEKKAVALKTATSREKSELVFSRHSASVGDRIVIVEDVCNNFSTTAELIKLITRFGGTVVGIACFLNRSLTVNDWYSNETLVPPWNIPVISLVRKRINEWRQDDPAVADDVARNNVVWKPKDEWDRLKKAMAICV